MVHSHYFALFNCQLHFFFFFFLHFKVMESSCKADRKRQLWGGKNTATGSGRLRKSGVVSNHDNRNRNAHLDLLVYFQERDGQNERSQ